MDLNLQGIQLTGNSKCKVGTYDDWRGLAWAMERKFYSFAEILSSLVRVSSGVKAGAYLQSSHIFTYQKTREFYLSVSAHFNTFKLRMR